METGRPTPLHRENEIWKSGSFSCMQRLLITVSNISPWNRNLDEEGAVKVAGWELNPLQLSSPNQPPPRQLHSKQQD